MAKLGPVPQKMVTIATEYALSRLPHVAAPYLNSAMVKLMDTAIDGLAAFPSARETAAKHLQRQGDVHKAVSSVIRQHTVMAGVQGVVTNIGGIASMVVGTPINITGLIVIQVRMVACIAHLYGYDLEDPRVRTALVMCLLGERELERHIASQKLPTTPAAVATSPVFDPDFHAQVADHVLAHLISEAAGKGVVKTVGRKTPIIGGGVGGVADWHYTSRVSRCARKYLHIRRPVDVDISHDYVDVHYEEDFSH
ncbi:MAG: EcsC family protein [Propionibacteriaceae bacterium]|nr:EcsC family protein [Propionibacteriaceae bacterium]